jgi:hypothetical protein
MTESAKQHNELDTIGREDTVTPRCKICWEKEPGHAKHCTRGPTPQHADAIAYKLELEIAMGLNYDRSGPALLGLAKVLEAVRNGATFVLTGPDPFGPKNAPRFGASIESTSGARHADAYGEDAAVVFEQLVAEWAKTTEPA